MMAQKLTRHLSKLTPVIALVSALVAMSPRGVRADQPVTFNIPSQDLGSALRAFAKVAHQQIVFDSKRLQGLKSAPLSGSYSVDDALHILLVNAGLTLSKTAGGVYYVKEETGEPLTLSQDQTASAEVDKVEEVIVTAQKREERAQDVPVSMTVLDPDSLAENGQSRLVDYFATVPGLSLNSTAFYGGSTYITIRGLSAGAFNQNATVATVIDDVPVGSSSVIAFGNFTSPDLDPSDLARIEVLKGPQGTLYGADSLGGLIKYVTADPSMMGFTGRVETTGMDIPGGGTGYAVRAAANIPVSDTFAIRVSAFSRRDPGYIDDISTGQNSINATDVYGAHLSALYRPSENLSLKIGALIQNSSSAGISTVNSDDFGNFLQGDLKQTAVPGSTAWNTQWQLYTATLNAKVAGLDITSVTGYNANTLNSLEDLTGLSFLSGVANEHFPGSIGYISKNHFYTEKITQEVRISSSVGHWLDWVAGAFYTYESSPGSTQYQYAANASTGVPAGYLTSFNYWPLTFTESAAFSDFTIHFTDRFQVQLGGRESWNRMHYQQTELGPATLDYTGLPSPYIQDPEHSHGDSFTYLLTPRFLISPDFQVYARLATGYRIGGPNLDNGVSGATTFQGIPAQYSPDKTTNYEVGIKEIPNRYFSFDAAAYYINWKNVQVGESNAYYNGFTTNAGAAKSEGVEASLEAHPVSGLTITAQGSYNYAVFTRGLPAAALNAGLYGASGTRLPYSIPYSGGITLNQDIHLSNDLIGFIGAAANYVGQRPYELTGSQSAIRLELPAYTMFNIHTGAHYHSWLMNLYLNNVADRRAFVGLAAIGFNNGNTGGATTTVVQPRTVGLNVARSF